MIQKVNIETVVDVGACVGVFIDDCMDRYDVEKIFAFEPLHANAEHLRRKYEDNSRVTVLEQAVSNFSGRGELYKKRYMRRLFGFPVGWRFDFAGNAGSSLKQKSNVSRDHFADVEVVSLSDFILAQDISRIDILKIDSEGSEYDILHDLLNNNLIDRVDKIYFEDHVRKVPGLEATKKRFVERVRDLGIVNKFYLQDVETGDDLAYVPMQEALKRYFYKVV